MTNVHSGAARVSAQTQPTNIGIIGLGRMGQAFGDLLIASGAHVLAYDLDLEKIETLARRGAGSATNIRDLADCEMVLTSLPDDDAVRAVVLADSRLCLHQALVPWRGSFGYAVSRDVSPHHRPAERAYSGSSR